MFVKFVGSIDFRWAARFIMLLCLFRSCVCFALVFVVFFGRLCLSGLLTFVGLLGLLC